MAKVTRDLIDYHGIDKCTFSSNFFKQLNLDFIFCVPDQKPDIEQIVKVWVKPCIVHQEIIKTPKGTSLEGQNITGKKLMINGDIELKVEYVACTATQNVHTAHTKFPFCSYVVLPNDFNPNTLVSASVLIEDVLSEQMDLRCIYNNITLMMVADIC